MDAVIAAVLLALGTVVAAWNAVREEIKVRAVKVYTVLTLGLAALFVEVVKAATRQVSR